ncbi:hypothetical protein Ancab_024076, partial [Ancistrocladus abbreviatus]
GGIFKVPSVNSMSSKDLLLLATNFTPALCKSVAVIWSRSVCLISGFGLNDNGRRLILNKSTKYLVSDIATRGKLKKLQAISKKEGREDSLSRLNAES